MLCYIPVGNVLYFMYLLSTNFRYNGKIKRFLQVFLWMLLCMLIGSMVLQWMQNPGVRAVIFLLIIYAMMTLNCVFLKNQIQRVSERKM